MSQAPVPPSSAPPPPITGDDDTTTTNHSTTPPGPVKLTARSCLYELCAKSHWNRPVFECCDEQGHNKHGMFTYKVIVEMEEGSESKKVIECIGKPQFNKKSAAESAAEGALWYLVHLGHPKKRPRAKKLR